MSWTDKAETVFSGKYVKFADGRECIVKFLKEPWERKFSLNGKEKISYEFEVLVNEVQKTMSVTSKRLMSKLIAEDRKKSLVGRILRIKAIGDGTARDWEVEAISE